MVSPTVVEEDPFTEALDITNEAEEMGHPDIAAVLHQNVQMSRGVEIAGSLLCVFRVQEIALFKRAQEEVERAPAQDVEMDCFGGHMSL